MLRNEKNRLTPEGNLDLAENQRQISAIYNQWRDKGYSVEEVYYMISTAAHECVLSEALTGKRKQALPRCHKCIYELDCSKDKDNDRKCSDYKRDAPDGGYYR